MPKRIELLILADVVAYEYYSGLPAKNHERASWHHPGSQDRERRVEHLIHGIFHKASSTLARLPFFSGLIAKHELGSLV